MKIAIITDQHFGFKKGSKLYHDYFLKFYEETFFPTLDREGITTILDLGDTFDNRKGIDSYSLDWAKKHYFDPIRSRSISMVSIVGNHTAFYKNTNELNTIDLLLREYDNITVVSECEELTIGGLPILFIPWINSENEEQTYDLIRKSKCKVAMGHLELNGFIATHGHTMEHGAPIEDYGKFKLVFSGHYHTRSSNGKIYYLGNPYEMFWNDVDDPRGFHIFDTEKLTLQTVDNPHTLYKRIHYKDTPRQLFKFTDYKDKIVKIIVQKKSSQREFDRFLNSLQKANPHDIKIVETVVDILSDKNHVQDNEDTMTLLNKYIDSIDTDLNKSKIKNIINDVYREASEVTV